MGHDHYTEDRPDRIQTNILLAPEDEETLFVVFPDARSRAEALEMMAEEWHRTAKIEERFQRSWIGNPKIPIEQIFRDYEAAEVGTKDKVLDGWIKRLRGSPYYRKTSKRWIHRRMIEMRRKL